MQKVMNRFLTLKKISILCLSAILAFAAYQHFWPKRVAAQSTAQTRILLTWISGSDAGYTSLIEIENTRLDPYGTTATTGTCTADLYSGGTHYVPGILPNQAGTPDNNFAPGVVSVITTASLLTAVNAPSGTLPNSGVRGYVFLTRNTSYVHAQSLLVNPGGLANLTRQLTQS